MEPSGKKWVARFPGSRSVDDLAEPFRTAVGRFLSALAAAGAAVKITETFRPAQRAYLMHFAYVIAREDFPPAKPFSRPDVDIAWVHLDATGQPDLAASKAAAEDMVRAYNIKHLPVLESRHILGRAIDMNISWKNGLVINDANDTPVTIATQPRTGAGNAGLQMVAATYGVMKLISDPPHWSDNGH